MSDLEERRNRLGEKLFADWVDRKGFGIVCRMRDERSTRDMRQRACRAVEEAVATCRVAAEMFYPSE